MKKIYILFAISLLLCCCQKHNNNDINSQAWLRINLSTHDNIAISRAVSGNHEEQLISNAIVYIFNEKGNTVFVKFYENLNQLQQIIIEETDIPGRNDMTIAVVANIGDNNVIMNIPDLNNINTKQDLLNIHANMNGEFIERGTSFMMSGMLEKINLNKPINQINIPLIRVDSKIRFNIQTGITNGYPVTFTPTEWRVVSAPSKVMVIQDNQKKNIFSTDPNNYFASNWKNYEPLSTLPEGTPEGVIATFALYVLENNITAKKNIPTDTGLTPSQMYALRDKQFKNSDGTNRPEFEYANDAATYIELKGNVHYKLNTLQEVSADVKFMIHLGGGMDDVDNYNNLRNASYTYNITIMSVNQIIVEVEHDIESRPGVEGNVVTAQKIIDNIDAYNSVLNIDFHQSVISNSLIWDVTTPFSKGTSSSNPKPKDNKWIYFRNGNRNISEIGGIKTFSYNDNFRKYPGDHNEYADEVTDTNVGEFLDKYISDIDAGVDKMLNIDQLIAVLKESKKRYEINPKQQNHLFDIGSNIRFTVFINEFYYEYNPENPTQTIEQGLWKKFTNVDKRILNILSNPKVSSDGLSSTSLALYSIRQSSIQTMYSRNSSDNFSGWGSQFYPQKAQRPEFSSDQTSVNRNTDLNINGRRNFYSFLQKGRWDEYINPNSWRLLDSYNYAKYMCLNLNRDMNGNETIDENEIQWYLASINQLTDLWIGEESYNPHSKLYISKTWDKNKQHYVSSTINNANNPEVLWASEGSSVGRLNGATPRDSIYYRCLRNFGLPKSAPLTSIPDRIYKYDAPYAEQQRRNLAASWVDVNIKNGQIDLSRLDAKSIRGFMTILELPDHELRDNRGYNKPFKKFEIKYYTDGNNLNIHDVIARSQPGGSNPVCPVGWRVPNQRELALMYSAMIYINTNPNWNALKRTYLDPWPLNNHFARTNFSDSWTSAETNPTYKDRPGFSVTQGGDVINLINTPSTSTRGGIRCVRDIR